MAQVDANVAWLNGSPAIRIEVEGKFSAAISLAIDGGRVTRIFAVSNPHKLAGVDSIVAVTRA